MPCTKEVIKKQAAATYIDKGKKCWKQKARASHPSLQHFSLYFPFTCLCTWLSHPRQHEAPVSTTLGVSRPQASLGLHRQHLRLRGLVLHILPVMRQDLCTPILIPSNPNTSAFLGAFVFAPFGHVIEQVDQGMRCDPRDLGGRVKC